MGREKRSGKGVKKGGGRVAKTQQISGRGDRTQERWRTKTKPWRIEDHLKTSEEAVEYLRAALEIDDLEFVAKAICDVYRTGLMGRKAESILEGLRRENRKRPARSVISEKTLPHNYRVIWIDEYEEYVGLCDEYQSLSWVEKDPKSAMKGIMELVAEVDEDLKSEAEDEKKRTSYDSAKRKYLASPPTALNGPKVKHPKRGELHAREMDCMDRLERAIRLLGISVFGSTDILDKWLAEPCPALGGISPRSLMVTAEGLEQVLSEMIRIEYGVIS